MHKSEIKWARFEEHVNSTLMDTQLNNNYYDVTFVSDEQIPFKAHKIVLSAFSSVLKNLLLENLHFHPIIYLRNVKSQELKAILQFMYTGNMELFQGTSVSFLGLCRSYRYNS